ncbi:fas-binding factor 1 homolog [Patagioenas fasciata]|uniref:fas-binding factor 1 homolog n=1 Tax=Patagioenas fasciata TaxID=372321 RepID=UPI003A992959
MRCVGFPKRFETPPGEAEPQVHRAPNYPAPARGGGPGREGPGGAAAGGAGAAVSPGAGTPRPWPPGPRALGAGGARAPRVAATGRGAAAVGAVRVWTRPRIFGPPLGVDIGGICGDTLWSKGKPGSCDAQTWGESLDVLRAGAELSGITGRGKKPGEGSGWLVGDGLPGTEDGAKPGGTRCCSPAFLGALRLQRRRKSPHPKQWPWVFLTLLPEAAAGSQHRTQGSEHFKYQNPPVSAPVRCSRGPQHQPPKGEAVLRHPQRSPCARPHPLAFQDKDDWDWDFLRTSKPSAGPQKMPVKRGTESSSETTAEQSRRKELPPRQTPLRTVAPVQRRKTSMFEDAEDDDLLDVLRRGKGPKKEEELRPARSTLDGLFGRGSAAKVLEKPEEEGRGDKKELVFGEYQPSMGSRPAVQPAVGQLVSSSETNPEPRSTPRPPRRRNPVRRRRAGDDWLSWEDEDFTDPTSQSRAAEEAAPKPDPMDWLIDALARRRAEEQAKAQEIKAETMETQEKKAKPSETEEKKAEPSEAQEKKNKPSETEEKKAEPSEAQEKKNKPSETEEKKAEPSEAQEKKNKPSEAQDTKAEPSETAGEGPGPRSPSSQLAASPAALDCRAELLSAQARVAELESQVQMLEEERAQQKVLLESAQRQHQEHLDVQESSHRTSVNIMKEKYEQQVEMLRRQNEQLAAQLRQERQDTARDRAELLAQHQLDLEQLWEQHRLELQQLRELQRESVEKLRKKHEEQLQHVKWLKEREMDVLTGTISHTRSLDSVVERMEKFSSDLQNVCRRSMEEEQSRVRELVANTQTRLGEQTWLLEQERAELKIQRQELKAKEEQLARDRQRLDEAWQEMQLEKEKVIEAVRHVQKQQEMIRSTKELSAQKHAEGERALGEARRMQSEFWDKLQVLQQQEEQLKQQEEQLKQQQEQLKPQLEQLKQQKEQLKQLQEQMNQQQEQMKQQLEQMKQQPEQLKQQLQQLKQDQEQLKQEKASLSSMFSAQMQLLKFQAQQGDKELEKQRIFLENLKKVRYNTARLSTAPPSSSRSVDDTIEYTHALIEALRKASPPVQVADLSSILRPPITFKTL